MKRFEVSDHAERENRRRMQVVVGDPDAALIPNTQVSTDYIVPASVIEHAVVAGRAPELRRF